MAIGASPDRAWSTLTDVQRVASWVTAVEEVEELDRLDRYTAVLASRMGPFRLRADLEVRVTELAEGKSIRFFAEGEDRQVASRITIDAHLELGEGPDGTVVAVGGVYEITGRVATMGASTIRNKADKILDEFFEATIRELA
ncbi:MAG TPA: SRPBCC domain-containing protein [Acidimicrobiia bacterium]|nr:SRPBCC domain-containing protein [Acidimicrobiia bacterium]